MFIKDMTVRNVLGIKEYGILSNELKHEVRISKGDYHIIANSILGLIALGLRKGDKITISSLDEESLAKVAGLFL